MKRQVASWGRVTRGEHEWISPSRRGELAVSLGASRLPGLAFGNGRSYGDVCLNGGGTLWSMRGLDRFIAFDVERGEIECEAGVLLAEMNDAVLPAGWFLPVTPGTSLATIGGAVANDVHGKNHHRAGTFGEHVVSMQLERTDGTRIRCGPDENADWFAATVGGMGLTGVIESVRLRLRRVDGEWIDSESESFETLEQFHVLSQAAVDGWEYTVAWVDCGPASGGAARGVLFRGNHSISTDSPPARSERRVPIDSPLSLVNGPSVRAFNALYRHRHRGCSAARQHYRPFFYPLDSVHEWNRIYGRRGFYQYQCVIPAAAPPAATEDLLAAVASSGSASFLAVLKTFSARPSAGMLSFPMAGTTLALDFPNAGEQTLRLFSSLDAIVNAAGGRLYPAKDACVKSADFKTAYPRWQEFCAYRDPGISSQMSRRLFGA